MRQLAFTGEDTANGKSWETWVSKKSPNAAPKLLESKQTPGPAGIYSSDDPRPTDHDFSRILLAFSPAPMFASGTAPVV